MNLAAVQTLAAQTAASKDTFDAISEDFYDSCLRSMQYTNTFDVGTCATHEDAAKLWQAANAELLSYVASLGALATDKQTDFGLTNLTSAAAGLKPGILTSGQQTAIVSAGKGLLSEIFAAQRRDALVSVMTAAERPDPVHNCPDGCLADLVKQLTAIAQNDYDGTVLTAEDGQIKLFYVDRISRAEASLKPGSTSPDLAALVAVGQLIAIQQYANEYSSRQNVAAKRAAAKQYVVALNQIVTAHHNVVKAIEDNSPEQIVGIASEFVTTYSAQLSAIRKAFK